jgi:antirestriction protein ArdC
MSKFNTVCEELTNDIIAELEKGVLPWNKPWNGSDHVMQCPKRHGGELYRGMNSITLLVKAMTKEYKSAYWMTFKQALDLGGMIKKGEKSTKVFYASKIEVEEEEAEAKKGNGEKVIIPYMKVYNVFNADQIEGLEDKFYYIPDPIILNDDITRNEQLDSFIDAIGADYTHNGTQAFFSPANDSITMPDFNTFKSAQGYYATFFHEITHWTGHKTRLDREQKPDTASYAFEELIAELGAVFLCAYKGIQPNIREDHAPYIGSWIKALKDDPKILFKAASQAQAALDLVIELTEGEG